MSDSSQHDDTDATLLRAIVDTRSRAAFARLAGRYVDFVYAAARRQVRDEHLAADVAQAVLIVLWTKAAKVKPAALASWLHTITRYAAANARKTRDRRAYHERRAATTRSEAAMTSGDTAVDQEDLRTQLDRAIAALGETDRSIVVQRYLQGRDSTTVAASVGLSPEAARKRGERALDRLRDWFAQRGVTVPAATLAATLLAFAEPAPAGVVAAIGGTATAGGASVVLAKQTVASLGWVTAAKTAATIVAASLAIAVAPWAIVALADQTKGQPAAVAPAPTTSVTTPTVLPVVATTLDDPAVRGKVQLVRWDVILNETGGLNVASLGEPVATASKVYQARLCDGATLREAVGEMIVTGEVLRTSTEMEFARDWGSNGRPGDERLSIGRELWFNYDGAPDAAVRIVGGSTLADSTFVRAASDRLRVALNYPDLSIGLDELTDQWRGSQAGAQQAIAFDGALSTGQAIAFVSEYTMASGTRYAHLIVWETFKAEAEQMKYFTSRDAASWVHSGPGVMRQRADAAREWAAGATHPSEQVAPAFEKKLEDGKVAKLVALCRPDRWPNCWWDAEGNPVPPFYFLAAKRGERPDEVWALVRVDAPASESNLKTPAAIGRASGSADVELECNPLSGDVRPLEVGALVGPWVEVARPTLDVPLNVNGVTYLVSRPILFGMNHSSFLVHFASDYGGNDQECLVAFGRDGKSVAGSYIDQVFFGKALRRIAESSPNFHGLKLADVDHFRVVRRKRQYVTFDGFARQPKVEPKTVVTPDEAAAAEAEVVRRKERAAADALVAQRRQWAAVPADDATAMGAVRLLVNAIQAGDEAATRGRLTSDDPAVKAILPRVARLLVRHERLRRRLVDRYGAYAVDTRIARRGIVMDVEALLMGGNWETAADGASQSDAGFRTRKAANGRYVIDVDAIRQQPGDPTAMFDVQDAIMDRYEALLQQDPPLTLEQYATAMTAADPTTAPAK